VVNKTLLTSATTGWAAEPIANAWKLDVNSSRFAISARKEQMEVYRETASGEIEMVLARTKASDGKSTSTRLKWPSTGGAVQDPAGALPKGETIVETLLR
jgi:hypothetical protein